MTALRTSQKPLRVGYLVDGGEEGGVSNSMRLTFEAMDRSQVTVIGLFLGHGVCREACAGFCDEVVDLNSGCLFPLTQAGHSKYFIPNLVRKALVFTRAIAATGAAIRSKGLDLVHVNMYPLHFIAGLACGWCGIPCVWHWHGVFATRGPRGFVARAGQRWLASVIACISRFVAQSISPEFWHKTYVVHNGVNTAGLIQSQRRNALRSLVGVGADEPLVGIFGWVCPLKGQEYSVRMAALVHERWPTVQFVIVGDETPALRRRFDLFRKLKIPGR